MPKRRPAPKYCYWRKDVLWFRTTIDGVEIRESLRTSDVDSARKWAESKRAKALAQSQHGEIVPLWIDAVTGWTAHIGDAISRNTALRYESSLFMVEPHFKGVAVKDIDSKMIGAFVVKRRKEVTPHGRPVSNATIRRDLSAIASVLDYAIEQDWCETNPARERARRIKETRDPITLPTPADIERVLEPMTGGIEDIARLAWLTGMRLDELLKLQRRHVKASTIFVAHAKGSKQRTIDLFPEAARIIARQAASMVTPLVFHHDGVGYSGVSSNFARAVKTAQRKAHKDGQDFTQFRFHDLRHFFAVEALQSGRMGLYELAKHLGHTSVLTTERHYLKYLTPEQAKSAKDGTLDGTRMTV